VVTERVHQGAEQASIEQQGEPTKTAHQVSAQEAKAHNKQQSEGTERNLGFI
jgi:hypothetical protein